ncbi:MAG TPA: GNAT family N-acetyltransferase [Candidatus Kapabacteria bacterium]|nr:GNAT family N-acetyltransferase [Candidatus Kapabacteria bacterium]
MNSPADVNLGSGITYRHGKERDMWRINELIAAGDLDAQNVIPENVLLAEDGGTIIGINRIKYHADGAAEIASAYVIPQYRGRGINEKLTRILMEQTGKTLYIITNPRNTDYVAKMGFFPVPAGYPVPVSIREKVEWCRVHYNVPDSGPGVFYYDPAGE